MPVTYLVHLLTAVAYISVLLPGCMWHASTIIRSFISMRDVEKEQERKERSRSFCWVLGYVRFIVVMLYMQLYIHIQISLSLSIYIYIHIERERERYTSDQWSQGYGEQAGRCKPIGPVITGLKARARHQYFTQQSHTCCRLMLSASSWGMEPCLFTPAFQLCVKSSSRLCRG